MDRHYEITAAAVIAGLFASAVFAQQIPPTAEPGRVEQQLHKPAEPKAIPPAPSTTPLSPTQAAPSNADTVTLTLRSLVVDGATVYASEALTQPYSSSLGQTVSLRRVYEIAAELTARYRNDGYILSSVIVPAQNITAGEVHLQAVEGFLGRVQFEGDLRGRDGMFESVRRKLLADRPLRTATLERNVLLINDLPDVVAQAVLKPAENTTGASELVIKLAQPRIWGEAGGTNRGSEVQGPVQYEAGFGLNSLFGLYEQTSFRYLQGSERDELWLGAVTHTERLNSAGLDLTLIGSISRSSPQFGAGLSDLNLETDTDQVRVELAYPLLRSRAGNLRARGALTYHDGLTDSEFGPISQDKISAVRLGLSFDSVDAWRGVNLIDVGFDQGVGAFGSSERGNPFASRVGGDPEFSKATLYLARLQSISGPFSILLAASGQAAFSNLLAPEEFAFGGEFYGRAYDPSEVVGDSGAAGKIELRYTRDDPDRYGMTLYAFYEAGKVWRRLDASEVGTDDEESAASAGGGLRFTFGFTLSGYIEGAVPLNHIVAAEGNDDARIFGGLKVSFGH